jgi:hypothetical protein
MWKLFVFILIGPLTLLSCSRSKNSKSKTESVQETEQTISQQFAKISLESLNDFSLDSFESMYAYQLEDHKLLVGSNHLAIDSLAMAHRESDWGDRLILLDKHNRKVFQPQGATDLYLYEPHFYQNSNSKELVVVCQRGFEYYFGGEVFLLDMEKHNFQRIGEINVESFFESGFEKKMVDVLRVQKESNKLIFSFECDSLNIFGKDIDDGVIPNNGVRYVFQNDSFFLVK